MSNKKTSNFKEADTGLFSNKAREVNKFATQEVQEVHKVQDVKREYGTTQGRKGQHAKRINMAFSDDNHEYITKESRRQGVSATAFVNMIINEYRSRK